MSHETRFAEKARKAFPGQVVQKGLAAEIAPQGVPRFVVEYLLARAGGGEEARGQVRRLLEERYLGPGHQEWVKDQLVRKGRVILIDRVEVRVDLETGRYFGHVPSLGGHPAETPAQLVEAYPGLLYGLWGTVELLYEKRVRLARFVPFQAHLTGLEAYLRGRAAFQEEEWLDFLLGSVGLEASSLPERLKLLYLARLAPLVEPNLHLMELGPRQTGKTYLLRNTSAEAFVVSGGRVSPAVLFYNLQARRPGLIPTYQALIFDEIAHTAWEDTSILATLKDYMESGQFSRGGRALSGEASLVFLGNADDPTPPVTRALPYPLRGDTAFLDRLHGLLPGHEFPKITPELLYDGPGLVVDYLSAAFRLLRRMDFTPDLDLPKGLTQRDLRSVRKWVSAFLKLLYPGRDWPWARLPALVELALELRDRVRAELHAYHPQEFPPRGREGPGGALSWDQVFPLLDPAYHPLFEALRGLGLPPPDEGPEDLEEGGQVVGQSLARWGDRYLLPPGGRGQVQGLEVAPDADPKQVEAFLRGEE